VHLIYNSTAADRNTGEMSRYISQLLHEPALKVPQPHHLTFSIKLGRDKAIVKECTEDVQQILQRYLTTDENSLSLSPTALNVYLDCRLQFYFKYVEGLKEENEIMDEIDPSIFGKLLHEVMENLYKGIDEISKETLERLQNDKDKIQDTLLTAFGEHFFHTTQITENDITGRNIIIRDVLMKYIRRIMEVDKLVAPFKIISLEDKINVQVPVSGEGKTVKVNLQGTIDRLEKTQDRIRIIDYKTGAAKRSFSAIETLFDRKKSGNHAAMQTLLYACITMLKYPHYQTISPCLYVVKELFTDNFDSRLRLNKTPIDDYKTVATEFENHLNTLLSEIFLSNTPFDQTEDEKKCRICPYSGICHRD
jgi:ATP-dependent helicase/DNAse subunit B